MIVSIITMAFTCDMTGLTMYWNPIQDASAAPPPPPPGSPPMSPFSSFNDVRSPLPLFNPIPLTPKLMESSLPEATAKDPKEETSLHLTRWLQMESEMKSDIVSDSESDGESDSESDSVSDSESDSESDSDYEEKPRVIRPTLRKHKCRFCGGVGHNIKTCKQKAWKDDIDRTELIKSYLNYKENCIPN